jgi:hypothetical protein
MASKGAAQGQRHAGKTGVRSNADAQSLQATLLPLLPSPCFVMSAVFVLVQRVSQTQNPLELLPEVESLRFHEPMVGPPPPPPAAAGGICGGRSGSGGGSRPLSARGLAPDVCESFAFQKDAIEFAGWCNGVGPGVVAALQVRHLLAVLRDHAAGLCSSPCMLMGCWARTSWWWQYDGVVRVTARWSSQST